MQDKLSSAREALDQAVSANFAVRESAGYALVRARVALGEGKPAEAAHQLQGAMALPGVKRQLSDVGRSAVILCMPAWLPAFTFSFLHSACHALPAMLELLNAEPVRGPGGSCLAL